MTKNHEASKILSLGTTKIYSVDPDNRSDIQKRVITMMINEAKQHLTKKKKIYFVLVKE